MDDNLKSEIRKIQQFFGWSDYRWNNLNYEDWNKVSQFKTLSYNFMREFCDKLIWSMISCYQFLSEDLVREFKHKLTGSWVYISYYSTLSESFIREFADEVSWYNIGRRQQLSDEFVMEFANRLHPIKVIFPDNSYKIVPGCSMDGFSRVKIELGGAVWIKSSIYRAVEMSEDKLEIYVENWR